MRRLSLLFCFVFAAFFIAPDNSYAKSNKSHTPPRAPVRIRLALSPVSGGAPDLSAALGRLDFQSKKGKTQLKSQVALPAASTTLAVTDEVTAENVDLHLELSRAGAVYNDCVLDFMGSADDENDLPTNTGWEYRVFVKTNGRQNVQGACGNGIPSMLPGDTVIVYATTVASGRVDILQGH